MQYAGSRRQQIEGLQNIIRPAENIYPILTVL